MLGKLEREARRPSPLNFSAVGRLVVDEATAGQQINLMPSVYHEADVVEACGDEFGPRPKVDDSRIEVI